MPRLLKENYFLIALCGINFVLSLVYILFLKDGWWVPWHEYTDIAVNIASGHGYTGTGFFHLRSGPSAFLMPFYSYLLALFIKLFPLPLAYLFARIFNGLVNILTLLMIYVLARDMFGKRAGLWSAAIFAFYIPFIAWTYEIWDTSLFCLFLLVILYQALNFPQKGMRDTIVLGLVFGMGILVNSVILLLLPFILFYLFFKCRKLDPGIIRRLEVIFLAAFIVVMPWMVRNELVFKAFVPLRTGFWFNLYLGNNPDATGTVFLKQGGTVAKDFEYGITLHFRPMIRYLSVMNEYQQDRFFKEKFMSFVTAEPLEFGRLVLQKIYYFWWFNPFEKVEPLWTVEYALVLFFAFIGLYQGIRQKKRIMLFVFVFVCFTAVYALTGPFFNWKYRLPIETCLIILAGYGLDRILPAALL
jgi:4-amino-4-deoxy-L-arabinose transferase-like glycosyltransferase